MIYPILVSKMKDFEVLRMKIGTFRYWHSFQNWVVYGALQHRRPNFKNHRYIILGRKKVVYRRLRIGKEDDQEVQEIEVKSRKQTQLQTL